MASQWIYFIKFEWRKKNVRRKTKKRTQKCEIIEFPDELRHQKMPINANRIRVFYRHLNKKKVSQKNAKKNRTIECGLNAEKHKIILCKHSLFYVVFFPTENCVYSPMGKFHFDADTTAIVFSTRPPDNSIHFTFTLSKTLLSGNWVSVPFFILEFAPSNKWWITKKRNTYIGLHRSLFFP